ncbi:hypothetical protein GW793_01970 [bacterium]|uniref:Uncharacterized protein n=2 Tax=Katanobacteria TaxID=422282 RepID=A0A2M7X0N3_UNCKA|nr:hypothetical protein [bacterium]PIP56590.1 MAG: hypothetical protein COX05_02240 [candidate division WWE3 bacterium CG22_combo_CG10-13_8_21_14_all_39_12]PJA39745.1 MAG: hypothetical protein CO179_04575 [candidate division WWE3 bacterium CG_4_9_14_3_um_filter_39_7]
MFQQRTIHISTNLDLGREHGAQLVHQFLRVNETLAAYQREKRLREGVGPVVQPGKAAKEAVRD